MFLIKYLKFAALLTVSTFALAADPVIPKEIQDRPDFFSKMEMIENISAIENLSDEDLKVVLNTSTPLPKTAQLEENATDKPEDQEEGAGQ